MSIKYVKINERTPHQEARFSVLLDDHYCSGNDHADVRISVRQAHGAVWVDLYIYGEDFEEVDHFSGIYTAEDLHISTMNRR